MSHNLQILPEVVQTGGSEQRTVLCYELVDLRSKGEDLRRRLDEVAEELFELE